MRTPSLAWLRGVVLGSQPLPLPEPLLAFLSTATAAYLDPFLDEAHGVPAAPRPPPAAAPPRLFTGTLRRAWAAHRAAQLRPSDLPPELPPEAAAFALAAYVRHAIGKSNMCRGFEPHVPGNGRVACAPPRERAHLRALGAALCDALGRDFAPEQRRVGDLARLRPAHVEELARLQLGLQGVYQHRLDEALAMANAQGEEGRRREQLRLFGFGGT